MEFFGARTIWIDMKTIIDPEMCMDENSGQSHLHEMPSTSQGTNEQNQSMPSTSQLDTCPNEIEFKK